MTRYDLTCACTSGDRKNSTLTGSRGRLVVVTIMPSASIETSLYCGVAWVGRLHHPVTAIEIPKRARMGGLLCVCFGEPFALNCYQRTNRKRPVLLCSTSRKYAFVKSNQRTRHFVGGQ